MRPILLVDFHLGGIGGRSGRKARSWMMGRSFRFCQYRIEWNYFSADLADHADADRTLSFRPRSTLICFFDEPFHEIGDMEPRVTGNHGTTKRQEKAAIKKVLARSRFALPIHDWPAMIEGGLVVARLRDSVPGPIVQSLPRRNWFPA